MNALLHHPDQLEDEHERVDGADHPPLEKRLAAVREIAREMGKPVS